MTKITSREAAQAYMGELDQALVPEINRLKAEQPELILNPFELEKAISATLERHYADLSHSELVILLANYSAHQFVRELALTLFKRGLL